MTLVLLGQDCWDAMEPDEGKKSGASTSSRSWCFTVSNYVAADEVMLDQLWLSEQLRYIVYGHEVSPTTGMPHLQGLYGLEQEDFVQGGQEDDAG